MSEENVTVEATLPEIVSELREIETRRAELEAAVAEAKKNALAGIVETIKKYITDNGYAVDEISALLSPAQKRKAPKPQAKKAAGPKITYTSMANPGNVYVRGVLPGWMKDEMVGMGFDPLNKADRDKFKAEHMICSASAPAAA